MENLGRQELWSGFELASKNAHTLTAVAEDAAKRGAFGAASALAVLAAEESAKALGLVARALNHRADSLYIKKYFRDHKHKHCAGAIFLGVMEFYKLVNSELSALEAKEEVSEEKKGSLFIKRMIDLAGAELSGESKNFESVKEWRENADSVKKRGFYIDWNGASWSVPEDVDQSIYEVQRTRAESLMRLSDAFVSLGYNEALFEYEKIVQAGS